MKAVKFTAAIAILQEALDSEDVQERCNNSKWNKPTIDSIMVGSEYEYRLKPQAREQYICWNDGGTKYAYDMKSPQLDGWDNKVLFREVLEGE